MMWNVWDPRTGKPANVTSADGDMTYLWVPGWAWDIAADTVEDSALATFSADDLRGLFLQLEAPRGVAVASECFARLLKLVDAFWREVEDCYLEDLGRYGSTRREKPGLRLAG